MASFGDLVTNLTGNATHLYNTLAQAAQRIRSFGKNTSGDLDEGTRRSTSSAFDLYRNWIRVGAAIGAALLMIRGVKNTIAALTVPIKAAAHAEQLRVQFGVLLKDVKLGNEMFAKLEQVALRTTFGSDELQQATKMLLAYGFTADQAMSTIISLTDVASAAGQSLTDVAFAYGTIKTAGRVYSRDLLQQFQGIPIQAPLADVLGIQGATEAERISKMLKMVEDGLVRFEHIQAAFAKMTGKDGTLTGVQAALEKTLIGKWNRLTETIAIRVRDIGFLMIEALNVPELLDSVYEMVQGGFPAPVTEWFTKTLQRIGSAVVALFNEWWGWFQNEGAQYLAALGELLVSVILAFLEFSRMVFVFNRMTHVTEGVTSVLSIMIQVVDDLAYAFTSLTDLMNSVFLGQDQSGRVFLHGKPKAEKEKPEWFKGIEEWMKGENMPSKFNVAGGGDAGKSAKKLETTAGVLMGTVDAYSAIIRSMLGAKQDKQLALQRAQLQVEREQLQQLRMMAKPAPAAGF